MFDKVVANASTCIALVWAFGSLLLVGIVTIANLVFKVAVDPQVFDLLKLSTVSSLSYAFGASKSVTATARALVAKE